MSTSVLAVIAIAGVATAAPGLLGEYYDDFTRPNYVTTFDPSDLVMTRTDAVIDFWNAVDCYYRWQPVASGNHYGVRWTGSIRIDVAGDYAFGTMSDDGSQVWLDGELIVDNGEEQWWDWEDSINEGSYTGLYPEGHGRPDSLPGPLYLAEGYHTIEVRHFEARSYDGIELWWLRPGSGPSDIPYYGTNCGSADLTINPDTNWEIVPSTVLTDIAVAVSEPPDLPSTRLYEAAPNPFNPQTTISFSLGEVGRARLTVYGLTGRRIAILADETFTPGTHTVTWNGRDAEGRALPSGSYLIRLETEAGMEARKVSLIR
jgi:hypothetical protein